MKTFYIASLFLFLFSHLAQAAFPIKNGQMTINISGDTGEDAGSVDLRLSYADAEKKIVKVDGSGRYNGKGFSVNETAPLATLKTIAIYASGGDGYNGSSGSSGSDGYSGSDGSSGWNGSDGCPPSDGSDGQDGTDGRDAGDGGDGTPGGDGGNGGLVRVTAPADQSELLLLIKASTGAGSGGYGGSGGSGGRGGRGGTGGRGGSGGRNNCKNDKGEPINGPDGRDGRNGSDGRNGRDGDSGRSAPGGSDGRSGSMTYISGTTEYRSTFKLDIASVKAIDDNEDTVVSPGETLHITEIVVKNSGPMPTPASQALKVIFGSNSTLVLKTAPAESLLGDVIPGNTTRTLTFEKGQVVLQAPDKTELVGKAALLSTRIAINSFGIDSADPTGLNIKWPVGISTKNDKGSTYFGTEVKLAYALTNVSSKDAGPSGPTTIDVEFNWVSKEIPGKDVQVALGDGRQFVLDRPYVVSDFVVPAKSSLAIPVNVRMANSGGRLTGNGTLKVILKLKDFSSEGKDAVDSASTAFYTVMDFRPVAFNKTWNTTANKIDCLFPRRLNKHVDVVEVAIAKDAKSDKVRLRISRKGFLSDGTSPVITVSAMAFAPYGGLLKAAPTANVLAALNKLWVPASAGLESTWQTQSCQPQRQ